MRFQTNVEGLSLPSQDNGSEPAFLSLGPMVRVDGVPDLEYPAFSGRRNRWILLLHFGKSVCGSGDNGQGVAFHGSPVGLQDSRLDARSRFVEHLVYGKSHLLDGGTAQEVQIRNSGHGERRIVRLGRILRADR